MEKCIYFRFKSETEMDSIIYNTFAITVGELKSRIAKKKRINIAQENFSERFELILSDEDTKKGKVIIYIYILVYRDNNELVDPHSRVLVQREPIIRGGEPFTNQVLNITLYII